MKGKIGQALSFGLPVVTTSIGAEGMDLVNERHVLVADDPEAFAAAVVRLYTDNVLWERISAAGRDHVLNNFSELAAKPAIASLLQRATHSV
jgi:glycosyltransferase involved in cell wall biosynthesis